MLCRVTRGGEGRGAVQVDDVAVVAVAGAAAGAPLHRAHVVGEEGAVVRGARGVGGEVEQVAEVAAEDPLEHAGVQVAGAVRVTRLRQHAVNRHQSGQGGEGW